MHDFFLYSLFQPFSQTVVAAGQRLESARVKCSSSREAAFVYSRPHCNASAALSLTLTRNIRLPSKVRFIDPDAVAPSKEKQAAADADDGLPSLLNCFKLASKVGMVLLSVANPMPKYAHTGTLANSQHKWMPRINGR